MFKDVLYDMFNHNLKMYVLMTVFYGTHSLLISCTLSNLAWPLNFQGRIEIEKCKFNNYSSFGFFASQLHKFVTHYPQHSRILVTGCIISRQPF